MKELKKYSVLFVEDDVDVAYSFSKILELLFGKVLYANNGLKALKLLDINSLDIIITDIRMPEMDGVEFIKEVRKNNKDIPIIVSTAYLESKLMSDVYVLDEIISVVHKPINVNSLIESLKKALKIELK